jgi:hypothetical protein
VHVNWWKYPLLLCYYFLKGCNFNRTDGKIVAILCKNNYNLLRKNSLLILFVICPVVRYFDAKTLVALLCFCYKSQFDWQGTVFTSSMKCPRHEAKHIQRLQIMFSLLNTAVKAYGEAELQRHTFLVSAPGAGERSDSSPVRFIPWGRLSGPQSHSGCFRILKFLTPPGCPNMISP